MQNRALHRFDMEAELRKALEAGHITAHFQPQQCLKSGTIAGAEALARWTRPDGTSVLPSDFIPVADEVIGMSDILFETMLRSVCNALSRWRAHAPWAVPIGVNLSAQQLSNRNLAGQIKSMLGQHQVDPQLINFELTETVLLEGLAMASGTLADLSGYGVGIQIDISFVSRMAESTLNARIIQAITALGKALNLESSPRVSKRSNSS